MGKAFFLSSESALDTQISNCEVGGTRPSRDLYVKGGGQGRGTMWGEGRKGALDQGLEDERAFATKGRSGTIFEAEATVCVRDDLGSLFVRVGPCCSGFLQLGWIHVTDSQ